MELLNPSRSARGGQTSYLRATLRDLLTREELKLLPMGFDRIGHVIILSLSPQLKRKSAKIGRALLQLRGVRTVAVKGEVTGRYRKPQLKIIAGEHVTETIHREHGCIFKLDVAQVMFSVGNLYERGRIAKLVRSGSWQKTNPSCSSQNRAAVRNVESAVAAPSSHSHSQTGSM